MDDWKTSTRFLPLFLGLVHGRVRLAEQLLCRLARFGKRHADTDGQPHLVAFEVGRISKNVDDAVGKIDDSLRPLHVDHQHREFIAAQARDGVVGTYDRREEPAGSDQDGVTDMVTESVVDRLEPVEVAEAQCHRPACAGRGSQRMLHPVVQESPVGQPGELVVEGQMPQIALEGITFPVGCLQCTCVFGDLAGLPGDLFDEPHHSQKDQRIDRHAQPRHHRNIEIQLVLAGHQQDGRGDEPGECHDRDATGAICFRAIDAGYQLLRRGGCLADRWVQCSHSDQDIGGEEEAIDEIAGVVLVVQHQQVVDEIGQEQADQ